MRIKNSISSLFLFTLFVFVGWVEPIEAILSIQNCRNLSMNGETQYRSPRLVFEVGNGSVKRGCSLTFQPNLPLINLFSVNSESLW